MTTFTEKSRVKLQLYSGKIGRNISQKWRYSYCGVPGCGDRSALCSCEYIWRIWDCYTPSTVREKIVINIYSIFTVEMLQTVHRPMVFLTRRSCLVIKACSQHMNWCWLIGAQSVRALWTVPCTCLPGLPWWRNFYPHTHPIPTENPVGIPTGSPDPQNPKILHTHTHILSFHYKRPISICCLSHWQLATTWCMFYAKVSVTDQRID